MWAAVPATAQERPDVGLKFGLTNLPESIHFNRQLTPQTPTQTTAVPGTEPGANEWLASFLVGTNFSASTDSNLELDLDDDSQGAASFGFSGQIGYLWKNVGIEGVFDFTPSVDVTRLESSEPSVSSYMANLITAIPFGPERRFQPYLSGGVGAVSMSTDSQAIFFPGILQDAVEFQGVSQRKFGWNLGVGTSAFGTGPIGFRGDLRYFRATSGGDSDDLLVEDALEDALDGDLDPLIAERLTRGLLSGLGYWRANVGLAIRW
jgi:opacity protein-like surface antigen